MTKSNKQEAQVFLLVLLAYHKASNIVVILIIYSHIHVVTATKRLNKWHSVTSRQVSITLAHLSENQ